jgi:hypothetical protein
VRGYAGSWENRGLRLCQAAFGKNYGELSATARQVARMPRIGCEILQASQGCPLITRIDAK